MLAYNNAIEPLAAQCDTSERCVDDFAREHRPPTREVFELATYPHNFGDIQQPHGGVGKKAVAALAIDTYPKYLSTAWHRHP